MGSDTFIDYLRHGTPEGGGKYRGQIDDPLSDLGWQQMRAAVAEAEPWTRVISSPLLRCRAFAEEIAARSSLDVVLDDRLKEVGFGEWEGLTGKEIDKRWPDARRSFYLNPLKNRPAGAEPLDDFCARCASVWDELAKDHAGERVLVVAHAGVIRATLGHVIGVPPERIYRFQVANASLTRIHLSETRPPQVLFHGRNTAV